MQQQEAARAAALAGAIAHDVNAPANVVQGNNGVNPVSASQANAAAAAQPGGRARRPAAPHVMMALRDELFDQSSFALATFLGVEAPAAPSVAVPFLSMLPEPISPHIFGPDAATAAAAGEEKDGEATSAADAASATGHADLIRHLIRSIHSAVEAGTVSAVPLTSRVGMPDPPQLHSLMQSQLTNEYDDHELSFRVGVLAQVFAAHQDRAAALRADVLARAAAARTRWNARRQGGMLSAAGEKERAAVNVTLHAFVDMHLQLLTAVQRLGVSDVLSSVLSTGLHCFASLQPLSLASSDRMAPFQPLVQFLAEVAVEPEQRHSDATASAAAAHAAPSLSLMPPADLFPVSSSLSASLFPPADLFSTAPPAQLFAPSTSTLSDVAVPAVASLLFPSAAPASATSSYNMADRAKALGILFGAALAAGNVEELLRVVALLYAHMQRQQHQQQHGISSNELGRQIGQFLPSLITLSSRAGGGDASTDADDSEDVLRTPLFTHAHPLKLIPLVYTGSWVCDSRHAPGRGRTSGCMSTGEGFVYHCEHNDGGGEAAIEDPARQAAVAAAMANPAQAHERPCGFDVCSHCVRREKLRQEKLQELEAGFPALSANGILKAMTDGRVVDQAAVAAAPAHAESPAAVFSSLSTPALCAVVLSQLARLSHPYHPFFAIVALRLPLRAACEPLGRRRGRRGWRSGRCAV